MAQVERRASGRFSCHGREARAGELRIGESELRSNFKKGQSHSGYHLLLDCDPSLNEISEKLDIHDLGIALNAGVAVARPE